MNDISRQNWKDFLHLSGSLWNFPGDADGRKKFQGAFILQIPQALMLRYTKEGDTVLDMFGGSGTTARAAIPLGRDTISTDIRYKTKPPIDTRMSPNGTMHSRYRANAAVGAYAFNFTKTFGTADLVILHPPYYDAIQFTDLEIDLSNKNRRDFEIAMSHVFDNAFSCVRPEGHVALVFGDTYRNGELRPAFAIANIGLSKGLQLKSIFVKDIKGNERGKGKSGNLWRYRALKHGFSVFEHEYIFVYRRIT